MPFQLLRGPGPEFYQRYVCPYVATHSNIFSHHWEEVVAELDVVTVEFHAEENKDSGKYYVRGLLLIGRAIAFSIQ